MKLKPGKETKSPKHVFDRGTGVLNPGTFWPFRLSSICCVLNIEDSMVEIPVKQQQPYQGTVPGNAPLSWLPHARYYG